MSVCVLQGFPRLRAGRTERLIGLFEGRQAVQAAFSQTFPAPAFHAYQQSRFFPPVIETIWTERGSRVYEKMT